MSKTEQKPEMTKEEEDDDKIVLGEPDKLQWSGYGLLGNIKPQPTAEAMPTITDEEIEAHFTTPHYHYEKGHYYKVRKDRIFGAKWMRDEIRNRMSKPNTGGEG